MGQTQAVEPIKLGRPARWTKTLKRTFMLSDTSDKILTSISQRYKLSRSDVLEWAVRKFDVNNTADPTNPPKD